MRILSIAGILFYCMTPLLALSPSIDATEGNQTITLTNTECMFDIDNLRSNPNSGYTWNIKADPAIFETPKKEFIPDQKLRGSAGVTNYYLQVKSSVCGNPAYNKTETTIVLEHENVLLHKTDNTIAMKIVFDFREEKPLPLALESAAVQPYMCDNNQKVMAHYYRLNDGSLEFVRLTVASKTVTLPAIVSASGVRYSKEMEYEWWIKGENATLSKRNSSGKWKPSLTCHAVTNVEK